MSSTDTIRDESRKDPDVLKREADVARAHVSDTLDALQQRLSPGQLLDQTMALVQRHGGEAARNLGASVKQNPLPTILTGIGIAWLMAATRSSRTQSYAEPGPYPLTGDLPGDGSEQWESDSPGLGEKLRDKASAMRERVADARHRVGDTASSLSHGARNVGAHAREQTYRAREGFTRMLDEQPLLLGLFGIAIGAALGASLPPTRREDELLGDARDRALRSAADLGSQQIDRMRSTMQESGDAGHADRETVWPREGEEVPQHH